MYYVLKYLQGLDGGVSPTQEACENMILLLEIVDIQAVDEVADDVDGITKGEDYKTGKTNSVHNLHSQDLLHVHFEDSLLGLILVQEVAD